MTPFERRASARWFARSYRTSGRRMERMEERRARKEDEQDAEYWRDLDENWRSVHGGAS